VSSLDAVYQDRLLELAATIARDGHVVPAPTATGTASSRACGSRIAVQVSLDGERVVDYGQQVDACALGSAAASVVGAAIIGATVAEVRQAAGALEAMLTRGGPPPTGAFAGLAALQPASGFTNRHGSMQLAFRALEKAFRSVGV
jgi:NifU-like protein involved in Fe-S cluster formation